MILCHSKNFLFIKTRKTGGTSLEIALSTYCSDDDIVTPISPRDELIRLEYGGCLPRNFSQDTKAENEYRERIERGRPTSFDQAMVFWNHMNAKDAKNQVPDELWRKLFKFTIERHPYEKAVSEAWYRYGTSERRHSCPFSLFLDETIEAGNYQNYTRYADDCELLVEEVLRYEELPDCLSTIEKRCGIDLRSRLPRTKHQFREDRRPAREVLSQSQKESIADCCRREFELFGFKY